MFGFFKKSIKYNLLPKIVIAFSVSGCMGHIKKFQWLGILKKTEGNIHKIRVIITENGDIRNGEFREEVAYEIQHLGFNIYVHYI